jgi:hypothetical protein
MFVLVQVVCSGVVFAVALVVAVLMFYHLVAAGVSSARGARSAWRGVSPRDGGHRPHRRALEARSGVHAWVKAGAVSRSS